MTGQTVTYRSYLAAPCCVNRCTASLAGRPATTGTHAHMSRLAPLHNYPAPDMASPISPTAREHHQGEQASWGGPGGTHVFRRSREGSSSRTSPAGPVSSAPPECLRQQQCHSTCTSQWGRGTGSCFQYHPSAERPNRWQFVRPNRRSFARVISFLMRGLYHFLNPSSYCFVLRFENSLANPKYQSLSRVELTVVSSTTSSPSMALTRSSTSAMA